MDRAIAITGMGMVTAQGLGVEATWQGVLAGREVLRPWDLAPPDSPLARLHVAACGHLPRPRDLPPRLWDRLSRTQQLACLAADEALASAGLPRRLTGLRVGLFLATTVCGMDQNERFYAEYRVDRDSANVDLMRRLQPYEVAALLARRHRISNSPAQLCLTTCVGSALAIANAADAIAQGECDLAIAGGAEALCRVVLSGFNALKVAAAEGCRPFDKDRPGMTVGEGSGILILESEAHAAARGARVLAWLRGVGLTCDAHHLTAPEPTGLHAARAIREALARAGLAPRQVDYLNAHGTGTRDNDAMESRAIRDVFGTDGPCVSSTKRCTGHTFGAAAAIEAILCVKALAESIFPGNAGLRAPQDPGIKLLRESTAHPGKARAVMSTNFAFGGNNAALVIASEPGTDQPRPAPPDRSGDPGPVGGVAVCGMGVVTDGYASIHALAEETERAEAGPQRRSDAARDTLKRAEMLDPGAVAQQDVLAQLVIRATHQAWTMAGLQGVEAERIGLLFVSAWGTIDATVAYLESMLEANGRYASPRHFSRSIYSSVASVTALHFGIRGVCQTLCFPEDAVRGGLLQAGRVLHAHRVDRVVIVWAEQSAAIAQDLCARAVKQLARHEYARFIDALGWGAVAVVLGRGDEQVPVKGARGRGAPFAMEAALGVVRGVLMS